MRHTRPTDTDPPLLHIVRVTATNCTFILAYCFTRNELWWSGCHKITDGYSNLHWRSDHRIMEGVLRTVCLVLFLLTLCNRRRAGCTLLGDLRSMSVLTELGIGWVWLRGNSSHDQRLFMALSQSRPDLRSPCQM